MNMNEKDLTKNAIIVESILEDIDNLIYVVDNIGRDECTIDSGRLKNYNSYRLYRNEIDNLLESKQELLKRIKNNLEDLI